MFLPGCSGDLLSPRDKSRINNRKPVPRTLIEINRTGLSAKFTKCYEAEYPAGRHSIPQIDEALRNILRRTCGLRRLSTSWDHSSMRCVVGWMLIGLVIASRVNAAPHDDESVRDPLNVVFEGVESFDSGQIRKRLALDIEMQVASHPNNAQSVYLKKLEELVATGYRYSGFPHVRATAKFDAKQRKMLVRVQEGARYRCSKVRVIGLAPEDAAALVVALTEKGHSQYDVPVVVPLDDGSMQTVWETVNGVPAKPTKPVWKVGEPVSFDKSVVTQVETRLFQWFWARGRVYAKFHAEIKDDDSTKTAALVVTIDDPGVPTTIGKVLVMGAEKNSAEDVLDFLSIRSGMPLDARTEARLYRRLWESGRLIRAKVEKGKPVRSDEVARVDLAIMLQEHPKAPAFATPLNPCEQGFLKLRDWLTQWTEGIYDDDLVIDARFDPSKWEDGEESDGDHPPPPARLIDLHVVTSAARGQVISVHVLRDGKRVFSQTLIARDHRAIVHSPQAGKHLEVEHSNDIQLISSFSFNAHKPRKAGQLGTSMSVGLSFRTVSSGGATPLNVKAKLAPLAILLESSRFANVESQSESGKLTLRAEGLAVEIDERTGKPARVDLNLQDRGEIHCRAVSGALQREFDRQDVLLKNSSNVFDADRPWNSLAVYGLDEYRRLFNHDLSSDEQATLAALGKLCKHWSIEPLGDLIRNVDDLDWSPEAFWLPVKQVQWAHPALSVLDFGSSGTLAGYLLPIYRELVPRTGWLWPMGRDGLIAAIGRQAGAWEQMAQYKQVAESGPLGHLTAAWSLQPYAPKVSQKLASHAGKRLSPTAFRADYTPLLAGDSWLGRSVLSLAEALRRLDESEIHALVRLLPDDAEQRQIAGSLLLLKTDAGRPIDQILPVVFERLWQTSLRPTVETALQSLAAGKSPQPTRLTRDNRIERTPDMSR